MNLFTATKKLSAIIAVLAGIGIDANDDKVDLATALAEKLDAAKGSVDVDAAVQAALDKERDAHLATTTVLREKADMFDALEKQATEAGIDLRAAANGEGIGKAIDGKARDHAKKILGSNAPEAADLADAPSAPPAGSAGALTKEYLALREAGDDAKASELMAKHGDSILANISVDIAG